MLRLAWRSLWSRPLRTLLTVLAVVLLGLFWGALAAVTRLLQEVVTLDMVGTMFLPGRGVGMGDRGRTDDHRPVAQSPGVGQRLRARAICGTS